METPRPCLQPYFILRIPPYGPYTLQSSYSVESVAPAPGLVHAGRRRCAGHLKRAAEAQTLGIKPQLCPQKALQVLKASLKPRVMMEPMACSRMPKWRFPDSFDGGERLPRALTALTLLGSHFECAS